MPTVEHWVIFCYALEVDYLCFNVSIYIIIINTSYLDDIIRVPWGVILIGES